MIEKVEIRPSPNPKGLQRRIFVILTAIILFSAHGSLGFSEEPLKSEAPPESRGQAVLTNQTSFYGLVGPGRPEEDEYLNPEVPTTTSTQVFRLGLSLDARRLSTVDPVSGSPGTLQSALNPGVFIAWDYLNPGSFGVFTEFGLDRVGFRLSVTRALEQKEKLFSRALLGGVVSISDNLDLRPFAAIGQESFYRSPSATVIEIDRVTVPQVGGRLIYSLSPAAEWAFALAAETIYLFGASSDGATIKSGIAWSASARLSHAPQDRGTGWEILGFYGTRKQDSDILEKDETQVGLRLNLRWEPRN